MLSNDLEDAKEVHKAFFPQQNLSLPGIACETFCRPARGIGGDYYAFLPLHADRWGIAIGDVCGKGIRAVLLMASLQASLRAQAMHAHSDLSTLIADVDRLVLAASPKHLYATLFYADYDPATRMLRYVNAGHNAPTGAMENWPMRGIPPGTERNGARAPGEFSIHLQRSSTRKR